MPTFQLKPKIFREITEDEEKEIEISRNVGKVLNKSPKPGWKDPKDKPITKDKLVSTEKKDPSFHRRYIDKDTGKLLSTAEYMSEYSHGVCFSMISNEYNRIKEYAIRDRFLLNDFFRHAVIHYYNHLIKYKKKNNKLPKIMDYMKSYKFIFMPTYSVKYKDMETGEAMSAIEFQKKYCRNIRFSMPSKIYYKTNQFAWDNYFSMINFYRCAIIHYFYHYLEKRALVKSDEKDEMEKDMALIFDKHGNLIKKIKRDQIVFKNRIKLSDLQ